MSLKAVSKDLGEIYARLFDHRPVLSGEINFLLGEFEEKRGDRELLRLQKSLEHIQEIDCDLLPQTKANLDKSLSQVSANVSTALQMADMVLEQENDGGKEKWLKQQRTDRVRTWTAFMDKMCDESAKVDAQYDAEVAAVQKFYKEVEEKLKAQNSVHVNSDAQS